MVNILSLEVCVSLSGWSGTKLVSLIYFAFNSLKGSIQPKVFYIRKGCFNFAFPSTELKKRFFVCLFCIEFLFGLAMIQRTAEFYAVQEWLSLTIVN